jgi:hypothetical protein
MAESLSDDTAPLPANEALAAAFTQMSVRAAVASAQQASLQGLAAGPVQSGPPALAAASAPSPASPIARPAFAPPESLPATLDVGSLSTQDLPDARVPWDEIDSAVAAPDAPALTTQDLAPERLPQDLAGPSLTTQDRPLERVPAGLPEPVSGELTGSYARMSVDDLFKAMQDDTWSAPSSETSSAVPREAAPFAAELAPMAADAQRLSLVLQDMAAFGAGSAVHDQEIGRDRTRQPVDFFA